jgi:RNA recognition motif-containing protein
VASDPEITARSVYVTGLAWGTKDEELLQHFNQASHVVSAVILRQRRGRYSKSSMGCGVVEFESPKAAEEAVKLMNETVLKGRKIRCREDRAPSDDEEDDEEEEEEEASVEKQLTKPKSDVIEGNKKAAKGKAEEGNGRVAEPNKVFVSGLAWETTEADLINFFSKAGEVVSAEVMSTKKGRSMGSGIVEFADSTMVATAIADLSRTELKGRNVSVRQYFR